MIVFHCTYFFCGLSYCFLCFFSHFDSPAPCFESLAKGLSRLGIFSRNPFLLSQIRCIVVLLVSVFFISVVVYYFLRPTGVGFFLVLAAFGGRFGCSCEVFLASWGRPVLLSSFRFVQWGLHPKDFGPLCFHIFICLHVCSRCPFELLMAPFGHSVLLKLPVMVSVPYFFLWLMASFIKFLLEKMLDTTSVALIFVRLVCGLQCDVFWRMFYRCWKRMCIFLF